MCEDRADIPAKVLRHVVLFAFKATSTVRRIQAIEEAFCALPSKIDQIHDFEWGRDVSVENLSRGYTHCFLVTFRSEKARDAYLPHPAHQEFVASLEPHLERALVIDFWADK
ncbi:Dabb family protein [Chloroflexota bacterium]